MKTVRMTIDVQNPIAKPAGRIDTVRVDATTEADIAKHKAADDAEAMLDAAKFARRVRRRLGFTQAEFAEHGEAGLAARQPGRKSADPRDKEIERLKKTNARLEKRAYVAEQLVDLQKKILNLVETDNSEEKS